MSNYLTRLIERSVGVPPQIEPLIAPLYAPSEQILSERTETIPTFGSALAKTESSERETKPGNPGKSRTEAAFSRGKRQGFGESPPFPEAPARFPLGKGDELSESQPRAPFHELSASPRSEILETTSIPLSPAMVSEGSTDIVADPRNAELSRPAEATEGSLHLSASQNRISVQPEIIGRRKPSPSSVPLPQPSLNEPPAIHVTIGRVEVRAVMSPSAPPKAPSRVAPRPSLEEYLKQRNGRTR
jgi:hypothetical protein